MNISYTQPQTPNTMNQDRDRYQSRSITLTFGDCAENHVGMQQIGHHETNGFTLHDLKTIQSYFPLSNSTIHNLKELGGESCISNNAVPDAYFLVITNGTNELLDKINSNKYELFDEQCALDYDKKALMYGRVVNKHARWNICFSYFDQEPDYENGKGRVVHYQNPSVRLTNHVKNELERCSGCEENTLQGEGNYYYAINTTGIGFHGDTERKKVIGVKLGEIIPFEFKWFYHGAQFGDTIHFELGDGDIYVMDEIATGCNWKRKNIFTLRHGAGCKKFL